MDDLSLCAAVNEMMAGLYEADLGGGLFKKRIARSGQRKRGGFRTLVASNKGNCWFFVFGFPKNQRSNINKKEEEALKKLASVLLSYTPQDLEKTKLENELMEVICNGEEEISDS
ncbi:MAG: type II toxin-antitoxin system RelE/ParE family toxin [Nostoc sp.]|uniref:type II toxin-antitoxin system RelE/ParE family toxin n=1 Tax=Nostoc sp. TaxID=1180 RepID=UPI002FF7DD97